MNDRYSPDRQRDRRSRHSYYDAPRQPHDDYDRPRDHDSRDHRSGGGGAGFTFRGAADRDSGYSRSYESSHNQDRHYCPQEEQFTFRAQGPAAPRFPEEQPPPRNDRRSGRDRNASGRGRGGNRGGRGGRGGYVFKPKQAHSRAILREAGREKTPEQLEGMNNGGNTYFKEIMSESEDEDENKIVDLTHESDEENGAPRKRTKIEVSTEVEIVRPKWSNPDPYTVLPPPETLGAPKKDIVQTIRKAKVEAAAKRSDENAVKDNVDFISFNFDDDDDDDEGVAEATQPPPNAPTAPSAQREFGFRDNRRDSPPHAAEMSDGPSTPPYDLVMPSDSELRALYSGPQTTNKRKRKDRGDRENRMVGDIVDEWLPNGSDPTPWCRFDHRSTSVPSLRLHKEVCDFYDFAKPRDYEESVRVNLVDRIERVVRSCNVEHSQKVQIRPFGSFAAGLYLPTADMDLVAVTQNYLDGGRETYCQSGSAMRRLGSFLVSRGIARPGSLIVIPKARVPIIKFTDLRTGIKVDISFENDSGLRANRTFQDWKMQYPAMPTLVVLIKQLVAMRGLNEVFSGGIGGFSIICLVVSMLQLKPEIQSGAMDPEQHYGELLVHFLDLYGNKFNFRKSGIRFVPSPGYYDKARYPMNKQKDDRLTIVDPNNPDNDISGGSSKINLVFDLFRQAHNALQNKLYHIDRDEDDSFSILGCIFGGNYSSFMRQRDRLYDLDDQRAAPPRRHIPPPPAHLPAPLPPKPVTHDNGLPHRPSHAPQPMPNGNMNNIAQAPPFPSRKVARSAKAKQKGEAKTEAKKAKKQESLELKKEAKKAKKKEKKKKLKEKKMNADSL